MTPTLKATAVGKLAALKRYGMIVADNRWNNDDLHALGQIPGSDFEVIDESSLMNFDNRKR